MLSRLLTIWHKQKEYQTLASSQGTALYLKRKPRNSSLSDLLVWPLQKYFFLIWFFFKTSFYGPQTNFYFFHDLPSVQYLTVLSGEKKDYNTPSMNFFPQSSICFLYK